MLFSIFECFGYGRRTVIWALRGQFIDRGFAGPAAISFWVVVDLGISSVVPKGFRHIQSGDNM